MKKIDINLYQFKMESYRKFQQAPFRKMDETFKSYHSDSSLTSKTNFIPQTSKTEQNIRSLHRQDYFSKGRFQGSTDIASFSRGSNFQGQEGNKSVNETGDNIQIRQNFVSGVKRHYPFQEVYDHDHRSKLEYQNTNDNSFLSVHDSFNKGSLIADRQSRQDYETRSWQDCDSQSKTRNAFSSLHDYNSGNWKQYKEPQSRQDYNQQSKLEYNSQSKHAFSSNKQSHLPPSGLRSNWQDNPQNKIEFASSKERDFIYERRQDFSRLDDNAQIGSERRNYNHQGQQDLKFHGTQNYSSQRQQDLRFQGAQNYGQQYLRFQPLQDSSPQNEKEFSSSSGRDFSYEKRQDFGRHKDNFQSGRKRGLQPNYGYQNQKDLRSQSVQDYQMKKGYDDVSKRQGYGLLQNRIEQKFNRSHQELNPQRVKHNSTPSRGDIEPPSQFFKGYKSKETPLHCYEACDSSFNKIEESEDHKAVASHQVAVTIPSGNPYGKEVRKEDEDIINKPYLKKVLNEDDNKITAGEPFGDEVQKDNVTNTINEPLSGEALNINETKHEDNKGTKNEQECEKNGSTAENTPEILALLKEKKLIQEKEKLMRLGDPCCPLCNLFMRSDFSYQSHCRGKKHKKLKKEHKKLGKPIPSCSLRIAKLKAYESGPPVGEEYLQKNEDTGDINEASFKCSLCNCPKINSKEVTIHCKSTKHRCLYSTELTNWRKRVDFQLFQSSRESNQTVPFNKANLDRDDKTNEIPRDDETNEIPRDDEMNEILRDDKKNEIQEESASNKSGTDNSLPKQKLRKIKCEVCNIDCPDEFSYATHLRGGRHRKELAYQRIFNNTHFSKQEIKAKKKEAAKNIPPIGGEYIQLFKDSRPVVAQTGKVKPPLAYCCICDCKFDFAAELDHLKGMRHRISYKEKVDPNFVVVDMHERGVSWRKFLKEKRQKHYRCTPNEQDPELNKN